MFDGIHGPADARVKRLQSNRESPSSHDSTQNEVDGGYRDTIANFTCEGQSHPPFHSRISFILSCFSQSVARGQLVVKVLRATRCESCGVASGQDTPVSLYLGNTMCEKIPQIVDLWEKTGS
jgi:hypothetical protein